MKRKANRIKRGFRRGMAATLALVFFFAQQAFGTTAFASGIPQTYAENAAIIWLLGLIASMMVIVGGGILFVARSVQEDPD